MPVQKNPSQLNIFTNHKTISQNLWNEWAGHIQAEEVKLPVWPPGGGLWHRLAGVTRAGATFTDVSEIHWLQMQLSEFVIFFCFIF